jgi:hypothetical protein
MNFWATCDFLDLITGFSSLLFLSVNILDGRPGSFSLQQSKRRRLCSRHEGTEGADVRLHSFLTWALPDDDYPASHLGRLITGRISPLPIQ